jgi:S-adenosylmethionine/arginine decarboxylase-like enzyme
MVRAEVKNPPKEPSKMNVWMSKMVKAIGMEELAPPRSVYSNMVGNRGLTADVLLNTSNACVHTWDEVDPAIFMIDVYSCGELDEKIIFELITEFKPIKIEFKLFDREHELRLIRSGLIITNKS